MTVRTEPAAIADSGFDLKTVAPGDEPDRFSFRNRIDTEGLTIARVEAARKSGL